MSRDVESASQVPSVVDPDQVALDYEAYTRQILLERLLGILYADQQQVDTAA